MEVLLTEFLIGTMGLILFVLPFLMPSIVLKILTFLVFALFCFFGYYLIRAVHRESRRREDAETIASRERILRREAEVLAADLRRLDRAKTQFLLSTQHHLRSPLSVINGYLSMINEESYGKITKKSKEKVGACLEANKKLIRLVDELLDVAHFQMNNSAAEKEPVDAVALAAQIVADLAPAAEAKNLYLKFKKTEVPIPEIMLNPRGIKEALYNIVDNAIKYTQTGGVIVLISVFGEKLRMEIKDTGIGLSEKDREGIFGRVFERCEGAKGANVEGKGIGLYLAAQIIANNGGKISVESEGWGKGSKFIIDLPMEDHDSGVKS
ncbi:MAG TPA: HAMP domain-containing sensor histidine kinase [Candidatus Pacearchaeota archaeon]|nr:HAMP domain-containing sensor histidine kinase [Candidatus Pacearchaeota archaeon]